MRITVFIDANQNPGRYVLDLQTSPNLYSIFANWPARPEEEQFGHAIERAVMFVERVMEIERKMKKEAVG